MKTLKIFLFRKYIKTKEYCKSIKDRVTESRESHDSLPIQVKSAKLWNCLLYTSPSPRDGLLSRMPSSA